MFKNYGLPDRPDMSVRIMRDLRAMFPNVRKWPDMSFRSMRKQLWLLE